MGEDRRRFSGRVGAILLATLCAVAWPSPLRAQSLLTAAGRNNDSILATVYPIGLMEKLAAAPNGDVFMTDPSNGRVLKVSGATGILSVFAGTGIPALPSGTGSAVSSNISFPTGIAVDAAGNVLIGEGYSGRIYRVSPATGILTIVASTGFGSVGGIAVDAAGSIIFSDWRANQVKKVSPSGQVTVVAGTGDAGFSGDGGPATQARLNLNVIHHYGGIAVDRAGTIYLADSQNYKVRAISPEGIIRTIAGQNDAGQTGDGGPANAARVGVPHDVTLGPDGSLYLACVGGDGVGKVRRIAPDGAIGTWAGGGGSTSYGIPATQASIGSPTGVTILPDGDLLYTSRTVDRVQRSDRIRLPFAGPRSRAAGDGGRATDETLGYPYGLAIDTKGKLLVADANDDRVRSVDPVTGIIQTIAGGGPRAPADGYPATQVNLRFPSRVAVDRSGNAFVSVGNVQTVYRISAATGLISRYAGSCCAGDAYDGDGGPATLARLGAPTALAVDDADLLYIASAAGIGSRVQRVRADGIIETVAGGPWTAGSPPDGGSATGGALQDPAGLAFAPSGDLYVTERGANRIRRVSNGIIQTVAGKGTSGFSGDGGPALAAQFRTPEGLWFDGSGNLFVADAGNNRVRKIAPDGRITTVAGNGTVDTAGDGKPATAAGLPTPRNVAVGPKGELYASTPSNGRVRVVYPCTSPAAPVPAGPADGATIPEGTDTATLRWTPASGAFAYDVYLDTVNPPAKLAQAGVPFDTPTPFAVPQGATDTFSISGLQSKTTYFWRVVAKGDPACTGLSTASSPTSSFALPRACTVPDPFSVTAPASGALVSPASATLAWASADGAESYDVYLSPRNPPRLYRSDVPATSLAAPNLSPSTNYFWYVVARAQCDPAKITGSAVATFTTSGPCADVSPLALSTPPSGATVSPSTTLAWSGAAGASTYDVYLGMKDDPPLREIAVTSTSVTVSGLTPGGTYYWKVVARSGCDPGKYSTTAVASFKVSGACTTPPTPSFFSPAAGSVGVGQTYVVAFSSVALDTGGGYLVERSASATFSPVLDSQLTSVPSASFVATRVGTYYHRVSAVAGCDPARRSAPSSALSLQAVDGQPVVVFSRPPQALVVPTGSGLDGALSVVDPDQSARLFAIQNLSTKPVTVIAAVNAIGGSPNFFQVDDPQGGSPYYGLSLQPQETRQLHLTYSGVPADTAGSYQGIVYLFVAGQQVVPYAYVNLKVGGQAAAAPVFVRGGTRIEYAAFEAFSAAQDDATRPPLSVDVKNPGPTPMELAAEIGPEVWLEPAADWNSTPIAPGSTRTLQLRTRRGRALSGSALPRYTYLTLRTRDGNTARLLVQDSDLSPRAQDPRAALPSEVASFVVPSVVNATSKIGNTFVSRLSLSNAASDDVQAELVFTPAEADGFDESVIRRRKVVVPHNDVVTLTDPLVQLFGLTPPAVGQLEVRADPSRLGALTVTSAVDAAASTGGTFGFQLPTFRRGEGTVLGRPHIIPAVTLDASYRSNVILAETTGRDGATVAVSLYDAGGTKLGEKSVELRRYGQTQFALAELLGGAPSLTAGFVEIAVSSGGGAVGAVVTVIDNVNDDASTWVSRPSTFPAPGAVLVHRFGKARISATATATATSTVRLGIPAVVNGYPTFPGSSQPYTFQTQMVFTSGTQQPATFVLNYTDLAQGGATTVRTVTVPARGTRTYDNVLEQLFGVPERAKSQGPVLVDASVNGAVIARVYSRLEKGTLGDSFPVIQLPPQSVEQLTGVGIARPLSLDGLEQSVDASRGTRSNLILNEWTGQPATVTVRLYEAGNRSRPIVEEEVSLGPWEKKQLSHVFSGLGLETDEKRKDRANVLCVVTPVSGAGLVSAVVTTIDNRTGDTRNVSLLPAGGTSGPGPTIGF